MLDLENQRLGKYEVRHQIGRGSMGVVYLGHDPFADRPVAIKVADPESLKDDDLGKRYRKLFFNEAKAAGMLRHPNIVAVYDANVEGDLWYIVMEYVAGGRTVHDYSRPDTLLPISEVVRIVFKCARALDYAHRNGVVHRDVKPRNLLLTGEREVKIGDFGVALITGYEATHTQVHGCLGSPLYMSPEQIQEQPVSSQSDLFALGVVTYQMLTGRHPFAGDNLGVITRNIVDRAHVPLRELRAEVPRVLAHIVDRTLKKRPSKRYRTGLDLAADLSLVFDALSMGEDDLSGREKYAQVRGLEFFREFTDPEVWELINASLWQEFEPGTEIITEGDADSSFYVIVSGSVAVRKGRHELSVLEQGDCFGEMGFIANQPRSASIIARSRLCVMKVRGTLIERATQGCQLRFHKVFLDTMVRRLSRANEAISSG